MGSLKDFDQTVREEIKSITSGSAPLEPSFVRRGIYIEQLLRYFEYFRREQVLIVDSRLLRIRTPMVLNAVIRFLELPDGIQEDFCRLTPSYKSRKAPVSALCVGDRWNPLR